ncbi:MAG: hypothetical protein CMC38_02985 [Flavobacteriaceae bacterium]|nr:hypothetical protein [Flavobacteriaceae bacterium]|tara:strand:- start:2417 stop:2887 length:471 start_codon:yes stop_codon:yes gene_type:complete
MLKIINFFLIIFLLLGCKNNSNQKKVVVPSSLTVWNVNDEFPSISSCEQIESESERKICFQQKLTKSIFDNIDFSKIVVNNNLNDTLKISILIDKDGKISIYDSEINLKVKKQIPLIDSILYDAINNLPKVLPAIKTNIGVEVNSRFELPIIIKTN